MEPYKNVMEILVEQEVLRQLNALPARVSSYIKQTELLAFALNQLPPLYATSEKGLDYQLAKGSAKFAAQITQSVQRAIAAVRRDPLRSHVPLRSSTERHQDVLLKLRQLLQNDQLEWETLPIAVEHALHQETRGELDLRQRRSTRSVHSSPLRQKSSPFPSPIASQPTDAYSASTGKSLGNPSINSAARRSEVKDNELFGWDDPLYEPRLPN
jgi:hypothetical protein